jgi:hypothetical protein
LPSGFYNGEVLGLTNSTNYILYVEGDGSYQLALAIGETKYFVRDTTNAYGWTILDNDPLVNTFALDLGTEKPQWNGTYEYIFDKYTCLKGDVYGIRNGKIYLLSTRGYELNGEDEMFCEVTTVSNKEQYFDKEFVSVAITPTVYKPTYVKFSTDIIYDYECILSTDMGTSVNNPMYLKNYGKWTNKIPRKLTAGRKLMQGRYLVFKISNTSASNFILIDSLINYKILKLQI